MISLAHFRVITRVPVLALECFGCTRIRGFPGKTVCVRSIKSLYKPDRSLNLRAVLCVSHIWYLSLLPFPSNCDDNLRSEQTRKPLGQAFPHHPDRSGRVTEHAVACQRQSMTRPHR